MCILTCMFFDIHANEQWNAMQASAIASYYVLHIYICICTTYMYDVYMHVYTFTFIHICIYVHSPLSFLTYTQTRNGRQCRPLR